MDWLGNVLNDWNINSSELQLSSYRSILDHASSFQENIDDNDMDSIISITSSIPTINEDKLIEAIRSFSKLKNIELDTNEISSRSSIIIQTSATLVVNIQNSINHSGLIKS